MNRYCGLVGEGADVCVCSYHSCALVGRWWCWWCVYAALSLVVCLVCWRVGGVVIYML
jgi:hypothetical protein